MSWLSTLTGIHISAPPAIQKLGDNLANLAIKAIPGAGTANGIFDLTNSRGGSVSLAGLAQQTGQNLQQQAQAAFVAADATGTMQQGGAFALLSTPVGLALLAAVVVLLARRS